MERTAFDQASHLAVWAKLCLGQSHLDRFCSSGFWGYPLQQAFQPEAQLVCYTSDDSREMAIFAERQLHHDQLIVPADCMWLLGTPILSPQPFDLFRRLLEFWNGRPVLGIRQVLVSGLYPENPLMKESLWQQLAAWELEPSARMIASLEGGLDGFMGRRSKNFRSRLKRMVKLAKGRGIEPEFFPQSAGSDTCQRLLKRIMDIERLSWKGQAGRGIDKGEMAAFYTNMIPMMGEAGVLRGLFLTQDGNDLAFLFGGLYDSYFRGLQFSYRHDQDLGLGNVCQYYMLGQLCSEGCDDYDLGQAMEYKRRWAEKILTSRSFVLQL